jgi:hypothetical protein
MENRGAKGFDSEAAGGNLRAPLVYSAIERVKH